MEATVKRTNENLPDSNVEAVARSLLLRALDTNGDGMIEVFQLLQARAIDIKGLREHSARRSKAMLAGKEEISKDSIEGQILEAVYETRCLKMFVAQLCRRLADELEAQITAKQAGGPKIKRVQFNEYGQVESFQLES